MGLGMRCNRWVVGLGTLKPYCRGVLEAVSMTLGLVLVKERAGCRGLPERVYWPFYCLMTTVNRL